MNIYDTVYFTNELRKHYPGAEIEVECAIANPGYVQLNNGAIMRHHSSVTAISSYNDKHFEPRIVIGPGTQIGPYNAFAAVNSIYIGSHVLFAAYVMITDHFHTYENINVPIMHQLVYSHGPVIIQDDSWIGFGCHILSGVTIGKHCVIGANSVVTKNIPAYSVVAGSPAEIIKQYNQTSGKWEPVKGHPQKYDTFNESKLDTNEMSLDRNNTFFNIDTVNNQVLKPQDPPIIINSENQKTIEITGWAIDQNASKRASGISINVDGQKDIPASYGLDRLDVAEYLKSNDYRFCGFSAFFDTSTLGKGNHSLSLKIVADDQKRYYKPDQKINIVVR
jgi:acetyltransferase-like isoleucine patch superfamily enzyme